MCSLVISHLDYANGILFGASNIVIDKLQKVQNLVAHITLQENKTFSSLKALFLLHWLPICARIEFKILFTVYKYLRNQEGPYYLKNLLVHNKRTGVTAGLRSNEEKDLLIVPYVKYQTFARHSFSVCGPKLWNNLPQVVKSFENAEQFKKNLKTHLFHKFVVEELYK